jgi:hypothetical protein
MNLHSTRIYGSLSLSLYESTPLWILAAFWALILYTAGRTPWTGDQPCRKAATYTQNKTNMEETHTDIHALSGIRTHDPTVRAGEDGSNLDCAATIIGWICMSTCIYECI